ncbi:nickel transporter [Rubrivivax gelatinosus]|nr:nickel transporter [Rubrivivax gelatinosus]
MRLIPVVDLMQGAAVRAERGERQAYRPLVSRLVAGHDPVAVALALCRHCASNLLYVADLDAIVDGRPQHELIAALLAALPGTELWLDAGFTDTDAATALLARLGTAAARVRPVFGSESLASATALERCFAKPGAGILSLDRRGTTRLDAAGAWERPALWPRQVIVMTLERVGSGDGPDLQTLRELQARSPGTRFIGAGGMRDAADLEHARAAGADAWLVASALHDGRLAPVA